MKEEKIRMGMERTFNGWIRTGLMFEPRGHDAMSGSILYDPVEPDGDLGVELEPKKLIRRRLGTVRVLPLGTPEMTQVLEEAGHTVVAIEDWSQAEAIAISGILMHK